MWKFTSFSTLDFYEVQIVAGLLEILAMNQENSQYNLIYIVPHQLYYQEDFYELFANDFLSETLLNL